MIKTIRTEVLSVGLKLMIGAVLSAILLFSIIQLAQAFQGLLSHLENGLVYEIFAFSTLVFVAIAALFLLFKSSIKPAPPAVDFQNLALILAEGLLQGFLNTDKSPKPTESEQPLS